MRYIMLTFLIFVTAYGPLLGMQTMGPMEQSDTVSTNKNKKFQHRYENYLGALDRGAASSYSTIRQFDISFNSNEEFLLLYPSDNFFKNDIPAYFIMSYFIHFEYYKIVNVNISNITVYDTGFTIIYDEYQGKKEIDYYRLDINREMMEMKLLKQLTSRGIELKHQNDHNYEKIRLQIFYHQEPKLNNFLDEQQDGQ